MYKYKIIRTVILSGFILISCVSLMMAQVTVSGTVTNAKTGKPMIGVNILVVGTTTGTATDVNGHYSLNVSSLQDTLRFSFIGFKTKKIPINGRTTINISMNTTVQNLNQLVVTALGIKTQQRSIGSSQQTISGKEIKEAPSVGLVSKLSGRASGVKIVSSSGMPGSSSRIVIRGANSITGNNQPLIVLNGVPISNSSSDNPSGSLYFGSGSSRSLDIDPSIIKSITVLKGGAATALYGSSAANGAILITTKSGQAGPMKININSTIRFDKAIIQGQQDEYLAGKHGHFSNGLPLGKGGYVAPGYPSSNPLTIKSWGPHVGEVSQEVLNALGVNKIHTYSPMKAFYQTGVFAKNSISASGGNENGTYFISGSRIDQKGTVPSTSLTRTNFNLNITRQILPKKLTLRTNISYINFKNNRISNGYSSAARSVRLWPINLRMKPYQYSDGTLKHLGGSLGASTFSPEWWVHETGFRTIVNRIILKQDLTYDVFPWLSISELFGLDWYGQKQRVHRNQKQEVSHTGILTSRKLFNTLINNYIKVNISNVSIGQKFELNANLGNNIKIHKTSSTIVNASDQIVPSFFDPNNFKSRLGDRRLTARHTFSFYGQLKLSYSNFLFLTLTGRNDWSSTLPEGNRSYFYPSASLAFTFSDLLGPESNSWLSFGKIRASIARTGNDAPLYSLSTNFLAPSYYVSMHGGTYGQSLTFPLLGTSGYIQSSTLGNPNLEPERTKSFEVGIDLSFIKNRVGLHVTYYVSKTFNQIYSTDTPASTGFSSVLRNAGVMSNRGTNVTINGTLIRGNEFNWNITVNWAKNVNDVVRLAPGVSRIQLAGFSFPAVVASEDAGYGAIRGYAYKRNENGQLIIDDNPNSANYGNPIETSRQQIIGSIQPNWTGSILTTLHFKGFTLSGLLDIKDGGDIINFSLNYAIRAGMAEITETRGTQMTNPDKPGYVKPYIWPGVKASNGEPNDIKVLRNEDFWERYSLIHENQVESAGYIKLSQLSLGYTLPQSILKNTPIRNASFTITAHNLWFESDFSYGLPQGSLYGTGNGGTGYYLFITPPSRSLSFTLEVGF